MSITDPIADMLDSIRNAAISGIGEHAQLKIKLK